MGGSPPAKGELRFNLLGFPVRVQPFFWLTAVFLGASAGGPAHIGTWVAVVFVSVLVHELGHAMAARLFGSPARIMLYGLGGLTVHRPMSSQWRSIAVSIAGPFAGFALAAVTFGVAGIVETLFQFLLFVNVGWGVVNLLPVLPLDGGHVARSAFRLVSPSNGDRWALTLSLITAGAVVVLAISRGLILIAVLFGVLAWSSIQGLQRPQAAVSSSDGAPLP
jgi:membrane-associated protease RseP (regulator of RpoE activity)